MNASAGAMNASAGAVNMRPLSHANKPVIYSRSLTMPVHEMTLHKVVAIHPRSEYDSTTILRGLVEVELGAAVALSATLCAAKLHLRRSRVDRRIGVLPYHADVDANADANADAESAPSRRH